MGITRISRYTMGQGEIMEGLRRKELRTRPRVIMADQTHTVKMGIVIQGSRPRITVGMETGIHHPILLPHLHLIIRMADMGLGAEVGMAEAIVARRQVGEATAIAGPTVGVVGTAAAAEVEAVTTEAAAMVGEEEVDMGEEATTTGEGAEEGMVTLEEGTETAEAGTITAQEDTAGEVHPRLPTRTTAGMAGMVGVVSHVLYRTMVAMVDTVLAMDVAVDHHHLLLEVVRPLDSTEDAITDTTDR